MASQFMQLCMKQLHRGLQRDHNLNHQGLLQYDLFLKGAGTTLEENTLFFQREFTRIMTSEQFNKQYAHSIRHTHDKEGKRASYTPDNCVKIIIGNLPQGGAEHHGCPYRHYDDASLGALLGQLKIGSAIDKDVIMSHKRDGSFQLACARHFEVAHPGVASLGGGGEPRRRRQPPKRAVLVVGLVPQRQVWEGWRRCDDVTGGGTNAVKAEGAGV